MSNYDVRRVCKCFLDFIYGNDILPKNIVEILKRHGAEWDFRIVCKLLNYKEKYCSKNPEKDDELEEELNNNARYLQYVKCWRGSKDKNRLTLLVSEANSFFHDVTNESDGFIGNMRDLIRSSEKENKNKYIDEIKYIEGDKQDLIRSSEEEPQNKYIEKIKCVKGIEKSTESILLQSKKLTPNDKKEILKETCLKKGFFLMKHVHLASLSSISDSYWVDLTQKDFSDGTTIFCVDDKEVKILNIKPGEVDYKQITIKKNKSGEKYSTHIRANAPDFKVEGTSITLGKYYSGSFPIPF